MDTLPCRRSLPTTVPAPGSSPSSSSRRPASPLALSRETQRRRTPPLA